MVTGRRRADTINSGGLQLESAWTIHPSELLADVYWTEEGDNRRWLRDRNGNALFSPRETEQWTDEEDGQLPDRNGDVNDRSITESKDNHTSPRRRKLGLPLKTSYAKRHRRLLSRASNTSSSSSIDSPAGLPGSSSLGINTGPLERYMQDRLTKEDSQSQANTVLPDMDTSDRWELMRRQATNVSQRDAVARPALRPSLEVPGMPGGGRRRSKSADNMLDSIMERRASSSRDLTRIETFSPVNYGASPLDLIPTRTVDQRNTNPQHKSVRSRLGLSGGHEKKPNKIAQTDFATGPNGTALPPIVTSFERPRSSFDSARSGSLKSHKAGNGLLRYDTNATTSSARDGVSGVKGLFKGGRIGGLVRGEGSFLRDRSKPRQKLDEDTPIEAVRDETDDTASDGSASAGGRTNRTRTTEESDSSPRQSQDRIKRHRKYHSVTLPDFVPADKRGSVDIPAKSIRAPVTSNDEPQQSHIKFDSAVRPRVILPTGESATGPDLFVNKSRSSEQGTEAPQSSYRRGAVVFGQRSWSISDHASRPASNARISKRDIARVQALLLASGIKVREILRRADSPRYPPNPLLVRAATTANLPVPQIPRRKDDMTAMRILSDVIDNRTSALEEAMSTFQLRTAENLVSRIDQLHSKLDEDLTTRVHDMSDSADAFVVELTTRQPQQTKQVDEAINTMLRLRRRQFRFLRRAGFKLLEWLTLGLMWGIWFSVIVVILIKRGILTVLRFVRWLFTL